MLTLITDLIGRNFGILVGYIVFFGIVYMLAAEYLSLDQSKGEVLVFRRNHAAVDVKSSQDEESGTVGILSSKRSDPLPKNAKEQEGKDSVDAPTEQTLATHSQKVFHWADVCYDISIKGQSRRILDHVDGWIKPGTLTALMV